MSRRHERRPSQRRSPSPEKGSIEALLDPRSVSREGVFKAQVHTNTRIPDDADIAEFIEHLKNTTLNTDKTDIEDDENMYTNAKYNAQIDIEPLPEIDYHLLFTLISLARPYLNKRDLKRYDYLADARRTYFLGHEKFQRAFTELQVAAAYSEQLEQRYDALGIIASVLVGEPTAAKEKRKRELADIETKRMENNEELRQCLNKLEERRKARDDATTWFSKLKYDFLQGEIPALVEITRQVYAWEQKKGAKPTTPNLSPPIALSPTKMAKFFGLDDSETSSSDEDATSVDDAV